jgi:hypothetical protein
MATHKDGNAVEHPPHYNNHPANIECIDVVEHMTFNVGNAIKYLWRAGFKGAELEDLKKAVWYVQREIERLEKPQPANTTYITYQLGNGKIVSYPCNHTPGPECLLGCKLCDGIRKHEKIKFNITT